MARLRILILLMFEGGVVVLIVRRWGEQGREWYEAFGPFVDAVGLLPAILLGLPGLLALGLAAHEVRKLPTWWKTSGPMSYGARWVRRKKKIARIQRRIGDAELNRMVIARFDTLRSDVPNYMTDMDVAAKRAPPTTANVDDWHDHLQALQQPSNDFDRFRSQLADAVERGLAAQSLRREYERAVKPALFPKPDFGRSPQAFRDRYAALSYALNWLLTASSGNGIDKTQRSEDFYTWDRNAEIPPPDSD